MTALYVFVSDPSVRRCSNKSKWGVTSVHGGFLQDVYKARILRIRHNSNQTKPNQTKPNQTKPMNHFNLFKLTCLSTRIMLGVLMLFCWWCCCCIVVDFGAAAAVLVVVFAAVDVVVVVAAAADVFDVVIVLDLETVRFRASGVKTQRFNHNMLWSSICRSIETVA